MSDAELRVGVLGCAGFARRRMLFVVYFYVFSLCSDGGGRVRNG